MNTQPRLAVSTWSLHRTLSSGKAALLDIPAQAAAHGFGALEIVHFHLPSTDAVYLQELRAALEDAQVTLHALLVDAGDPTHPDPQQRASDLHMMAEWVEVAAVLGAQTARAVAGHAAATPETLALSAAGLRPLAREAAGLGLRLTTENWYRLLDHADDVLAMLALLDGALGLKVDFGNWPMQRKHDGLARIAPHAESTHAKAFYGPGREMNRADYVRCLDICRDAGFAGTHTLIFDADGDEWPALDAMRAIALPYVS